MENAKYLISLISSVINSKKPENAPPCVDFNKVFAIAKGHRVLELLAAGVDMLDEKPSEPILKELKKAKMHGALRSSFQDDVLNGMLDACAKNNVDILPLKGSVMKELYPHSSLRNMCDLDLLVRKEDLEKAGKLLEDLGLTFEKYGEHDVTYKMEPYVSVELHFLVTDTHASLSSAKYYENIWNIAKPRADIKNHYYLEKNDYYVSLIEHMCKHYRNGGCGIKAFIDIYLYNEKYKDELDREYINRTLDIFGMREFSDHALALAYKWFGGGAGDELSDEMERYVIAGLAFGTTDVYQAASHSRSKKRGESVGKFSYIIKRIFPPYYSMCYGYPKLKRFPFLLPFMWVHRWFYQIFVKKKKVKDTLAYKVSDQKVAMYEDHMKKLGIDNITDGK
ncbi:MAG: nucleotidyltransferase family protein [Clostridia bacterium]|nr:nucleotidyltransferase family protein [Clostridia bacterium]